jgi:hypothetical protein
MPTASPTVHNTSTGSLHNKDIINHHANASSRDFELFIFMPRKSLNVDMFSFLWDFRAKFVKWMKNGEVVSVLPHVSSPKILNAV